MARTPSGKCIGMAARIERQEMAEYLRDHARERNEEFLLDYGDALNRLKEIDPDWEAWYDGRPEFTLTELYPLIENRVADIEIAKFGAELRERQEAEWRDDAELERDRRAEIDFARYGY